MADELDVVKSDVVDRMEKAILALKDELSHIRTGRANPTLLDRIRVDYYGTPTELKGVASISVPDPRTLAIKPWEKSMFGPIEKAIQKSDLGLPPNNDGIVIRLTIPDLTEDRRRDLVKQVKKKGEDRKVAIRSVRREGNDAINKAKKDGVLPEDVAKNGLEEIQKITDRFIAKVDELIKHKEDDVMSV